MTHRLNNRVSKLEADRPNEYDERIWAMSHKDRKRLLYLKIKRCFAEISDEELEEMLAIDGAERKEKGPFGIDNELEAMVNKLSLNYPEYRQFATKSLWLEDRNHILKAIGGLSYATQELSLPDELVENISPLIKRLDSRYIWGYEPPFTDEDADILTEALSGFDLGPETPWFREYLRAHSDLKDYYRHNGGL